MIKSTNSFTNIDNLGRIVIPKHLRKAYELESGCAIEFLSQDDTIVLRKYQPGCTFCGNISELTYLEDKCICSQCIEKLTKKD